MKRYIKEIIKETIVNIGDNPRILKENEDLTTIKSLKRSIENKLKKFIKR